MGQMADVNLSTNPYSGNGVPSPGGWVKYTDGPVGTRPD